MTASNFSCFDGLFFASLNYYTEKPTDPVYEEPQEFKLQEIPTYEEPAVYKLQKNIAYEIPPSTIQTAKNEAYGAFTILD